jgi:two-component system, NarL family, nitrate/nitrite response regulator NarL
MARRVKALESQNFGAGPNRYPEKFGIPRWPRDIAMDHIGRHPTDQATALGQRLSAARMVIIERSHTKAELLQFFCAAKWGFDIVAVENTGVDGLAAVRRTEPDVILVGLPNLEIDAADIISELRRAAPPAKIVGIISQCSEYLVHSIGATECHGLVYDADESLSALGLAIERVRNGMRSVSARIVQCQTALRTNPSAFPKLLSDREQEVLICIAHSLSDDEIAQQLHVSAETALSHRKKIMRKLNIHSTPKLIGYCMDKGFCLARLPAPTKPPTS